jgi:(1->4)-alpha-D-glucan 1-alpha-D-glucosylmutase
VPAVDFRATYRLQLTPEFGFAAAEALVPYLRDLGVSHLYLSPSLQARSGSQHGYDVVDPTKVSADLGGEAALRALADTAHAAGLGLLLDIVPNHMAVDDANPFWADEDKRARYFDLDPATGRHRRFFDVDELAAVRQEDAEVFATTHEKLLALVHDGVADGLRVDHPDGLTDPAGYLARLRDGGVEHVWVEKILDGDERLRASWATEGTVGYEFLNDVSALLVDPAGEAPLSALWASLSGDARPFRAWADEAKLEQARTTFAPEADRLRAEAPEPVEGLEEALASLPVYRTYVEPWHTVVAPEDRAVLAEAGLADGPLGRVLTLEAGDAWNAFVTRFQQTTPPVMAKGVEDTAFYRYLRLPALNDVGGDPGRFSLPVEAFHDANRHRAREHPLNLLSSTTHDTKRSGDVRARLCALAGAGIAEELTELVPRWLEATADLREAGAPDDVEAWLVFSTLLGAWPIAPERLEGYLEKALREAKRTTNWVEPDEAHEGRVFAFARAVVAHAPFLELFEPFVAKVAAAGERIGLVQTLLKLTVPGVPDIYQGDEMTTLSLVDPDNRRPVDFDARREALARLDGGAAPADAGERKLAVVAAALRLRDSRPAAFTAGAYEPLDAGPEVCAFVRGGEVAVVTVLRGSGADAAVTLPPGRWRSRLAEREDVAGGAPVPVASVCDEHGLALLSRRS